MLFERRRVGRSKEGRAYGDQMEKICMVQGINNGFIFKHGVRMVRSNRVKRSAGTANEQFDQ